MKDWTAIVLVFVFLILSIVLASNVTNEALSGQIIAASASITVAVVGFWFFFRKPKP
jgi:lipopolysaccharide export LptBFGC system permease protein LptF